MSILSDKYKIPEPTIKNMIQDGVISCSWSTFEEVIRLKSEGKSTAEIAESANISISYVHKILRRTK